MLGVGAWLERNSGALSCSRLCLNNITKHRLETDMTLCRCLSVTVILEVHTASILRVLQEKQLYSKHESSKLLRKVGNK